MASEGAGSSDYGSQKIFSGENEDGKEYLRWKVWISNKLLTLDKIPANAKGAYVYTMLAGKALECVEHLPTADYQKEGGEAVLFKLLDKRFPQKETSDEMSEILTEIFSLKINEGESLKSWISRGSELFDRCQRKTNVSFPDESRGWLLLHRAGLSSEQMAVILARSVGSFRRDDIGKAMRSCYPDYVYNKKKVLGASLVEDGEGRDGSSLTDEDFADVEQFLAEFESPNEPESGEIYEEKEVAEVLAVTWKERRKDLTKLQRQRKFTQAGDVKRQFRVEVEELKKRTRCHRCNKVGHWSKECRAPKGAGKGKAGKSSSPSDSGAAIVEEFVAMVTHECSELVEVAEVVADLSMLQILRKRRTVPSHEQLLVSSPGYGIIDSGCGRTIIGSQTLQEFRLLWKEHGLVESPSIHEVNHFRFGNGSRETSHEVAFLPVILAGRVGTIRASVVRGRAPLLISRRALQTLKAKLDFENTQLTLFEDQVKVPIDTNAAGQMIIYLLGKPETPEVHFEEVMLTEERVASVPANCEESNHSQDILKQPMQSESEPLFSEQDIQDKASEADSGESACQAESSSWSRRDSGLQTVPIVGKQGPSWEHVFRRVVTDVDTSQVLFDHEIDPSKGKSYYRTMVPPGVKQIETVFHFHPQEQQQSTECLSAHQIRQLASQVRQHKANSGTFVKGKRLLVSEVFSPPRFAPVAEEFGFAAQSFDLKNGWDFSNGADREKVASMLDRQPPDLLVLCPPCTDEGGWWHLNSLNMSPVEVLRRRKRSRMFIRYCCRLFEQQVAKGRLAVFEHPWGSQLWGYPEVRALQKRHFRVKCHMCCFGLRLPNSPRTIKKATGLLVSHSSMQQLARECPGSSHPAHVQHDQVAGRHPEIGAVSVFAGQYTLQFVESVLQTVPSFAQVWRDAQVSVSAVCPMEQHEVLTSREDLKDEASDQNMKKAIDKLHRNLGHPSNRDLVRILTHGQAASRAIELARHHECDFCKSQSKPHVPLPAKVPRIVQFNESVGVDVKWLPGWKPNQKVKAVNIVDQGSCFQQVVPFFEVETSLVIRQVFMDSWVRWAGFPQELVMDQAATNVGEAFQDTLETHGTTSRFIAAEAHWQLGRTEVHGGWFARVLEKVILEHSPTSKEAWLDCVVQAHVKNQMIQNHGHTPFQHVFGKNPNVPGDLLSEPLHIVPGTAGLSDDAVARAQSIRTTARQAVISLQDDRSLRQALNARPRAPLSFNAGDLVAYWRQQKYQAGAKAVVQGGRWHGTAVVIGNIGRNVVIAHRRQIFRCAPEQLRFATTEERTLITSPDSELLGIKDMIEGGTFASKQFVDLVSSHYPPSVGVDESSSVNPSVPALTESAAPDNSAPVQDATSAVKPAEEAETVPDDLMPDVAKQEHPGQYGPVRRRVAGKSGENTLYRPPAMKQEDFIDVMREMVPQLLHHFPGDTALEPPIEGASSSSSSGSGSQGQKRELSPDAIPEPLEPPASRARLDEDEILTVEEVEEVFQHEVESLMAAYLQKKVSKELPPSNNEPVLQKVIDASKTTEWTTLSDKNAIRVHYGKKAEEIRRTRGDRFMGSRFVIIRKPAEEGQNIVPDDSNTYTVKSRWCLQGHLDPDLDRKAVEGLLKSPTLSQIGRMVLMQLLSSHGWSLQLGDIKGAFLEAGPLPEAYRPLYAEQPRGGIPGLPSNAVIEVVGNVYGQNDAPHAWYKTFDEEAVALGWVKSKFDCCLYFLWDSAGCLKGVMGVHVDDTATGGEGELYEQAIAGLKKRFPYRKWRVHEGEFCGAFYRQCPRTFEIAMEQEKFAESLKPAQIPRSASASTKLNDGQIRCLRAINGSLNWLSSQTRPDLSSQTSFSQQAFPKPTINHLREASNAIRRAKQHKDVAIRFKAIPCEKLALCVHSDAAFANRGDHTQAGYIVAFVDESMQHGALANWTPITWKSYRLPRAVSSTLGAEAQAMSTATGTAEWISLILAEALDGPFEPRDARRILALRSKILVTDCKSLYDHLVSPSSPTAIEDRRTSIDVVIIRESIKALQGFIRWVPTNRMIADGLTKDKCDPVDLLRSCVRAGEYQISPEETVLERQACERERRLSAKQDRDSQAQNSMQK